MFRLVGLEVAEALSTVSFHVANLLAVEASNAGRLLVLRRYALDRVIDLNVAGCGAGVR